MSIKVALAKKIGFCFGVKRAVAMAEAELEKNRRIYSLGSIIHNKQVVDGLAGRGLKVIDDIGKIRDGVVIISSHGISPKVSADIKRRGLKIIDTTCPFVLNAQNIARKLSSEGYKVVIVGDANHPEVKALVDFAPGSIVVKDQDDARRLKLKRADKVSVISQTTQSTGNFLETVSAIAAKNVRALKVVNTICRDAGSRQDVTRRLARKVDAMLIVGGRNSANTRRLFEVSKKICRSSHHIETEKDIRSGWFKCGSIVGITSGASTPDCIIARVVQAVESKFKKN
jgi:(E)-4-hydroxy-3-methyl-but-2-enyl pyrophosphate reductase